MAKKVRNVVKHLTVETAVAQRMCHTNSKHVIAPGDVHLADATGFGRQNICRLCAGDVLDRAEAHLRNVRATLGV